MKKKIVILLLSAMLVLSSCGSNSPQQDADLQLDIPAEFVGEQTQEDLNKIAEEYGIKSITLNDDGSATYVMTSKQHEEFLN